MKFGVTLPTTSDLGDPGAFGALAQAAEGLGFDSVWVPDHIIIPAHPPAGYPYGKFHLESILESTTMLGTLVGATERISVGTNVLVLPLRDPLVLARQAATLDYVSGGRLILGIGVGWMREEFEALGVDFDTRGVMTDEYIDVLRACWAADPVRFDGAFVEFDDLRFLPLPTTPGGPPIYVGGHSPPALRRVGRQGDGWNAWRLTFDEISEAWEQIAAVAAETGRDASTIHVHLSEAVRLDAHRLPASRRHFHGDAEQIAGDIAYAEMLGVATLGLILKPGTPPDQLIDGMSLFASEFMADDPN